MISKLLASGDWAYNPYDAYVTAVIIRLEGASVIVIKIYNSIGIRKL